MRILKRMYALLTGRERYQLLFLLGLTVLLAAMELAAIGSVSPLLMVMADTGKIQSVAILSWIYSTLGFVDSRSFLIFLACAAIAITFVTQIMAAAYTWAQVRFLQRRMYALTLRLMSHYLHQPYAFFLNRNSSDLSKNILVEAQQVISEVLTPLIGLIASVISTLAILGLLLFIDTTITLLAILIFGGGYGLVYILSRRHLFRLGKKRLAANKQRFKYSTEAFSGIKEIKILGSERSMLSMFKVPAAEMERVAIMVALIRQLPKYALHLITFSGVISIAIVLVINHQGDLSTVLPTLGIFAFASFRLMPRFQGMFTAVTKMLHAAPVVNKVFEELSEGNSLRPAQRHLFNVQQQPLALKHELVLHDIQYTYPGARKPALKHISLTLPANETIGFMGPTGSGKSTLADILLGLLDPQQGQITVDGQVLDANNVRAWMEQIGYVPQHIFLADDSVERNIAFGVPPHRIDHEAVRWAARIANIDDFITQDMPAGYATAVGDRGIRLSGGQRQRIGIARALYRNPGLLLLDEATSALDTITESAVMEAINALAGSRTIIVIAHRISTLAACSQIYELHSGKITRAGSYAELFTPPSAKAQILPATSAI